jgi:hypothetical protein
MWEVALAMLMTLKNEGLFYHFHDGWEAYDLILEQL